MRRQADRVALMQHQIGQRRGDVLGILKLAAVLALVLHAAAGVDEQMGFEVCFLFILLDIIAIRFAVSSPVDVADFVAVVILAMLGELHAETLVGAFVNAGKETLDGVARIRASRPYLASEVGSNCRALDGIMGSSDCLAATRRGAQVGRRAAPSGRG